MTEEDSAKLTTTTTSVTAEKTKHWNAGLANHLEFGVGVH